MRSLRFAIVIGACAAVVPAALACSCLAPPPPLQAVQQSAAVFLGKVIAIEDQQPAGSSRSVTIAVEKWWKGGNAAEVKVVTSADSASCGFDFQRGSHYLVYAYASKANEPWNVSLCSRTAGAKQAQAAGDFEALGPGMAPKRK